MNTISSPSKQIQRIKKNTSTVDPACMMADRVEARNSQHLSHCLSGIQQRLFVWLSYESREALLISAMLI
jgi:hypothetical protein